MSKMFIYATAGSLFFYYVVVDDDIYTCCDSKHVII